MTDAEEEVLVVPRDVVVDARGWHGVRTARPAWLADRIARHGRFLRRSEAEADQAWKQVIPYLVLRDGRRYFLMQRTRGGADSRLHDLWTIGLGGHLNPGDGGLRRGLRREWAEEIEAEFVPRFRMVGLLNDDTTAVGRVHVGAVYVADARGRPAAVREVDKLRGSFAEPAAVRAVADRLETWSLLAFEFLESRPEPG